MFFHTNFFDSLSQGATTRVWANSAANPYCRKLWQTKGIEVREYPTIYPFKEFPYNFLRRLNEYNWDYRQRNSSRLSMMRLSRGKSMRLPLRTAKYLARLAALFPLEQTMEDQLERLLLGYDRSQEATVRLQENIPDVVLSSGPFQYSEPAIIAAAKRLRIPTLALIPSWDNLSTKNRLVLKYDGYMVWSDWQKRELRQLYPASRDVPCYVVGAPQFDVFFQRRFYLTRTAFCQTQGLDPNRPIIVYALGSPNFLREHHGAVYMATCIARGDLGDAQMIVRPHPIYDNAELSGLFSRYFPQTILQRSGVAGAQVTPRFQEEDQITEWVNTFRHADVVINLSSTVTIDAAIFDRPVVNLDYDPEPGQPNQALVKDVNHLWSHFKPIAESGAVWLVDDPQQMIEAVKGYLADPSLHRARRRWVAEYVCQFLDGQCGERMASAILDFIRKRSNQVGRK
jgi:hypothetical protein